MQLSSDSYVPSTQTTAEDTNMAVKFNITVMLIHNER